MTTQMSNDLAVGDIHIWRIDLDGPTNGMSTLLSSEEVQRAEDRRQDVEKNRFILAHGAKRSILGDYLGVAAAGLEFAHGEKGKPVLKNPGLNIEFNLSHCENMALLAVSKQTQVGVDLERIRTRSSQLQIARRMFPQKIYLELKDLSADQLDTAFFKYWTELEARTKCVGDGIFSANSAQDDVTIEHFTPQDGWMACVAAKCADVSTLGLKHFLYRK